MALQQAKDAGVGHADVVQPNRGVAAAAREHSAVAPSQRSNAAGVARVRPHEFLRRRVPQLHVARGQTDREVISVGMPGKPSDVLISLLVDILLGTGSWIFFLSGHQLRDFTRLGVPEIKSVRQGDGEDVARTPVEEVEVEVVK